MPDTLENTLKCFTPCTRAQNQSSWSFHLSHIKLLIHISKKKVHARSKGSSSSLWALSPIAKTCDAINLALVQICSGGECPNNRSLPSFFFPLVSTRRAFLVRSLRLREKKDSFVRTRVSGKTQRETDGRKRMGREKSLSLFFFLRLPRVERGDFHFLFCSRS